MRLLLTSVFLIALLAGTLAAEPALRITDSEFDFGWIPHSSHAVHSFWFKSTGTDTLRIAKVKTSCGCIHMPLDRDWLAPGDSMKVEYSWETGRRIGGMEQYSTVHTNVERDKPYYIRMEAICLSKPEDLKPLSVKPYRLELSRLAAVSIDSIEFVFTNHSPHDFTLTAVSPAVEQCEIVLPETVKANGEASGFIKVHPEFADEEFLKSITLEMSSATDYTKRMTIPIRRKIFTE